MISIPSLKAEKFSEILLHTQLGSAPILHQGQNITKLFSQQFPWIHSPPNIIA